MGTGVRGPILWIPPKTRGGVRVETRRQLAGADGTSLGGSGSEGVGVRFERRRTHRVLRMGPENTLSLTLICGVLICN